MGLLNLQHLKNKYSLNVRNLAYIGANKGQDVDEFLSVFPDIKISLFEPQDELFSYLKKNFGTNSNISLFNFAIGSSSGKASMYIADNDGQSSSFLKPKDHLTEHPEIKFDLHQKYFDIKTLDELNLDDIDLINIDTQGYELEVLKGSHKTLMYKAKYIILEINKKELYEGCPMIKEIDLHLKKYNFIRTDTHYWMDLYSWGDAFYIKKDLINNSRYIFSVFKNKLYNIQKFYKHLIALRNFLWKLRGKTS